MEHFLAKKGPKPYQPTGCDKLEVEKESKDLIVKVLKSLAEASNKKVGTVVKISPQGDKANVRWVPTGLVGFGIWASADEEFTDFNNVMFYSIGGAQLTLTGKIVKIEVGNPPFFDIDTDVTIKDHYDFPDKSGGSAFQAYVAANFLERKLEPKEKRYQGFWHSISFKKTYTVPGRYYPVLW
jgi:hypothetical protein